MNDKTREQIEAMKNQTIGVEIEMNNITREKAARKVAEYFGTRAWNAASEYGYYSWACKDQQGRVWKFQRDVSIFGPDAEKCELVTPILTYDDIETLQEIIRLLRKAGAKSSPSRGCGVHIHIGKGDHTAKTIRNLVNIMAAHEQQIGRAIRIDEGRTGHYCQVVNHRFLDRLNREKPTTMRKLEDIWYEGNGADYGRSQHYNSSRYHMLNLHATFTKGTIEFRLFQFADPADGKRNGLHAGEMKAYIQLGWTTEDAACRLGNRERGLGRMKVLLIKPMEHPQVVDIENSLKEFYRILDCDCITATYPWEERAALVTDDNGLFTEKPFSRYIAELEQPIKGNFFICGLGEEDFAELPQDLIRKFRERFWVPEAFVSMFGQMAVIQMDDGTKPE